MQPAILLTNQRSPLINSFQISNIVSNSLQNILLRGRKKETAFENAYLRNSDSD